MKIRLGLAACAILLLGSALGTQAHSPGGFAHPAGVSAVTIPSGATVGPQILPNRETRRRVWQLPQPFIL
jgi:hypothetical protein